MKKLRMVIWKKKTIRNRNYTYSFMYSWDLMSRWSRAPAVFPRGVLAPVAGHYNRQINRT